MSHTRTSHVSHTKQWSVIGSTHEWYAVFYEWIMSHMWTSHVSYANEWSDVHTNDTPCSANESCLTCEAKQWRVIRSTYQWYTLFYERVMSHMWTSHVSYINEYLDLHKNHTPCPVKESCLTHEAMKCNHITHPNDPPCSMNESCLSSTEERHGTIHKHESCHTYKCVMSHTWSNDVWTELHTNDIHTHWLIMSYTHINELCRARILMSHVSHVNESCLLCEWVIRTTHKSHSHTLTNYILHTFSWVMSYTHINESCLTCERVMSHMWLSNQIYTRMIRLVLWMSHVSRVNIVMSHLLMSHVPHVNESGLTCEPLITRTARVFPLYFPLNNRLWTWTEFFFILSVSFFLLSFFCFRTSCNSAVLIWLLSIYVIPYVRIYTHITHTHTHIHTHKCTDTHI